MLGDARHEIEKPMVPEICVVCVPGIVWCTTYACVTCQWEMVTKEMPGFRHTWVAEDVGGAVVAVGERADAGGPVTSACWALLA